MERINTVNTTRILGLDPGLSHTGWGILDVTGNHLSFIACGRISSPAKDNSLAERLNFLFKNLAEMITLYQPDEAAVEETFMNNNAMSALKLGMARGVVLLAPAHASITVFEYGANHIKKALSGYGHANKEQMGMMIKMLLPTAAVSSEDAADALAVAVCHAHQREHQERTRKHSA
jgi:crossover junction endodeoxyribonuclease RuvC